MSVGAAPRTERFPTLAKYDVLEELGHGGMATVYRAHDKRLGRDVAVKVIHPHLRDSKEIIHRFSVEAQAVAKLRHANIVEVYDVSAEDEPEQYLVVELLRGKTLRKILAERGALPPEVAAALGLELLSALAHAHTAGVIHRDVKPENVILEYEVATPVLDIDGRTSPGGQPGDRAVVKLTDFGIAKLLDAQGVTSTGQVLGSPAHMAPEQIEGGDVDGRADIFAVGVLLYECMVGHLPFEGNNPAQVLRRVLDGIYASAEQERPKVGKGWSLILDRALAQKVEDRYPSALAMRDALVHELTRLGVTLPRGELEAWCDDPAAYDARHDKLMIDALCQRAAKARKDGDAIAAAADYNRALAYAPHDAALLKIASTLQRADARRRFLRQVAPIVLATLVLGAMAFYATQYVTARREQIRRDRLAASLDAGTAVAVTSASPSATVAPVTSTTPSGHTIAPMPGGRPVAPIVKVGTRDVVFQAVRPPRGVLVAVDGEEPLPVEEGKTVTLDTRAHTLQFTCQKDTDGSSVCEPKQRTIEAGDKAERVDVRLTIKSALLRVDGDPKRTYGIREYPGLRVVVGDVTVVPLSESALMVVHVVERETDNTQGATLRAGRQSSVSFLAQPAP